MLVRTARKVVAGDEVIVNRGTDKGRIGTVVERLPLDAFIVLMEGETDPTVFAYDIIDCPSRIETVTDMMGRPLKEKHFVVGTAKTKTNSSLFLGTVVKVLESGFVDLDLLFKDGIKYPFRKRTASHKLMIMPTDEDIVQYMLLDWDDKRIKEYFTKKEP